MKLRPEHGGIGFPDLDIRIKVNRLAVLIRVLSSKEELSWRRCFYHFYSLVEFLSKKQLKNIGVPTFYKEIRLAVIESRFGRDGDFIRFFGERLAIKTASPKMLYDKWIKHQNFKKMSIRNNFWADHLGVSEAYVSKSWQWAKTNFADGMARDTHYKVRHKSLFTNHKASNFIPDVQPYCTLCSTNGMSVREDNTHLLIYCPRAYELYAILTPALERIAGIGFVTLSDLILGRTIDGKSNQTCFNLIIQHSQLAIWQSRNNMEKNRPLQNTEDVFRTNLFRNPCRVKTVQKREKFFEIFGPITEANDSVMGFRLFL
jgi:hypothetical protein